mmetsp:Transcript_37725/g.121258  ORF Transcript_37725/g.121258 Transcript_37725/m.121258 type:complete len:215 (+) Transcript_37725:2169-2813(+)|eukprot:scaffold4124_cov109-Isochrysis_galbana.AAC.8
MERCSDSDGTLDRRGEMARLSRAGGGVESVRSGVPVAGWVGHRLGARATAEGGGDTPRGISMALPAWPPRGRSMAIRASQEGSCADTSHAVREDAGSWSSAAFKTALRDSGGEAADANTTLCVGVGGGGMMPAAAAVGGGGEGIVCRRPSVSATTTGGATSTRGAAWMEAAPACRCAGSASRVSEPIMHAGAAPADRNAGATRSMFKKARPRWS